MNILVALTKGLPIGNNLALLQFLWMLVSGALLPQRGAIVPALNAIGLSDPATRRAPGRFPRMLMGKQFPQTYPLPSQLRKKASVTGYLPKGILAPRRKTTVSTPATLF
jgi:hypothetical protein